MGVGLRVPVGGLGVVAAQHQQHGVRLKSKALPVQFLRSIGIIPAFERRSVGITEIADAVPVPQHAPELSWVVVPGLPRHKAAVGNAVSHTGHALLSRSRPRLHMQLVNHAEAHRKQEHSQRGN